MMFVIRGASCAPAKVAATPRTMVYVAASAATRGLAPECSAATVGQETNAYDTYIEPNMTDGIRAITHLVRKLMSNRINSAGTRSNKRLVLMNHSGSGNQC